MTALQSDTPIVQLRDISIGFGDQPVHQGISFDIFPGEIVTLLGPSGTGKTVILKIIIGLLRPDSGSVKVFEADVLNTPEERLFLIRQKVGMLFQGAALFDSLSVFDNVAFPLRQARQHAEAEIAEIVHAQLALVGLPKTADKFPPSLSGGQKKRIGLARALATSPKIVLFDEPTTGLDPTSKTMIDDLMIFLRDSRQITSVVVTHDMESARKTSDRLILLANGRVMVCGEATELWDNDPDIMRFAEGRWDQE